MFGTLWQSVRQSLFGGGEKEADSADSPPFEFLDPGHLIDGELRLLLEKKVPGNVPVYRFRMYNSLIRKTVGSIELRIGHTEEIDGWLGHIGYGVDPSHRGQRYAARSCRLLLPLARRHGLNPLWITCDPDNLASRRTCEILGAELVEIFQIPPDTFNYRAFEMHGETVKCRYRLALE